MNRSIFTGGSKLSKDWSDGKKQKIKQIFIPVTDRWLHHQEREVCARAVRMVLEHQKDYNSQSAAISAIVHKIGCILETMRRWMRQKETHLGLRDGVSFDKRRRMKDFVARAICSNVPLKMQSMWMGHATIETTYIYANVLG